MGRPSEKLFPQDRKKSSNQRSKRAAGISTARVQSSCSNPISLRIKLEAPSSLNIFPTFSSNFHAHRVRHVQIIGFKQ
jgi:hypothetical protein